MNIQNFLINLKVLNLEYIHNYYMVIIYKNGWKVYKYLNYNEQKLKIYIFIKIIIFKYHNVKYLINFIKKNYNSFIYSIF